VENDIRSCIAAIGKVVTEDGITIYFQPVVSLLSQTVIGFEAFARGVDETGATLAGPVCLFNASLPVKAQIKVEELCLIKSFDAYRPLYDKYRDMLLFMNINCGIYSRDEYKVRSPHQQAESYGYSPRMITFEMDSAQLKHNVPHEMISGIREKGYRISIDNVDTSPECLDIIFDVKPDFVKLDSKFYKGIEESEAVKLKVVAAADSFKQYGTMPVAKGVESEAEALELAMAGFYLQQGFFYADNSEEDGRKDTFGQKIKRVSDAFRESRKNKTMQSQKTFRNIHLLLKSAMTRMQQEEDSEMNRILEELLKKKENLISGYVLDATGKQISKRFAGRAADPFGLRMITSAVGSDHSDSEIFIYLNSGFEKTAGYIAPNPLSGYGYHYVAGFFYKEGSRRGRIIIIDYIDVQDEESE